MLRKIGKWVTIALFLSLIIAAFAAPARCIFDNSKVSDGSGGTERTQLQYSVTGTECFVSWNFDIFINVTYVNATHAFGNISDTSDEHTLLTNGENISLSIMVIRNVTDWTERPNIHNTTESQLLEHWNSTYVNFHDTGVYEDQTRDTVSINFTIWTPEPEAGGVWQNFKIAWDNSTGALVEYVLVQTHPDDQQYSGSWSMILAETSLWGITAEGIPSFPLEILLFTSVASICGLFLSKKMRRRTSE